MTDFDSRLLEQISVFVTIEIISAFFLVLIIAEITFDFFTKRRPAWRETMANFAIYIGNILLDTTVIGTIFVVGIVAPEPLAIFDIPITWWSWSLAIIGADLTYYWMHRIEHERRILWAVHSVHHSSQEYNLTTSFRLSWFESLFEWLFLVPMVVIGFDPVQVLAGFLIIVVYQTWIHTEKIRKLGWLDSIFNTPSVHRVHHGSNAKYVDRNYGGILMLWDHLFGTYQAEEETVIYGMTKQLKSSNPILINFHEFARIAKDVFRSRSAAQRIAFVFSYPGWKPATKNPSSIPNPPEHFNKQ